MVCNGDFGIEDDISNKLTPKYPRKMNKNYCTIVSAASTTSSRYRGVNTTGRFRRPISLSNFSYAFLFLMFACSCSLMSDAVSPEPSNAYSDSGRSLNNFRYQSEKKCTNSNCNEIERDVLKNYTIQKLKDQILKGLGFLNGPPNTSKLLPQSSLPPPKMLSLNLKIPPVDISSTERSSHPIRHSHTQSATGPVNIQNDENKYEDVDDGVKTHTVVAKAEEGTSFPGGLSPINEKEPYETHGTVFVNSSQGRPKPSLLFRFESISKNSITNARLLLYQKALTRDHPIYSRSVGLTVYKMNPKGATQLVKHFPHNLSENATWVNFEFEKNVATKHLNDHNDSQPLIINLVIYAKFSLANDTRELPFVIDTKQCDNITKLDPDCNVPFLQLEIEDSKNRRSKREANTECRPDADNTNNCCRYPLTVDFEAFKWDFIIAPKRYEAHYCAGECTFLSQQRFPHTQLTTQTNSKISPCCGPRSMKSIAMLYYNTNNNIVYGVLPGMIVERCGCQ